MCCEKYLAAKIKLRYYKEVIDPTLEEKKYVCVLTSSKKKINIAKIRTNSHELHSETGRCAVHKHHGWKGSAISVRIRTSRMKITSSQSAPRTTTLDLSFKISVAILTFLAFYNVTIMVGSEGFSPSFLSIEIKS